MPRGGMASVACDRCVSYVYVLKSISYLSSVAQGEGLNMGKSGVSLVLRHHSLGRIGLQALHLTVNCKGMATFGLDLSRLSCSVTPAYRFWYLEHSTVIKRSIFLRKLPNLCLTLLRCLLKCRKTFLEQREIKLLSPMINLLTRTASMIARHHRMITSELSCYAVV